MSVHVLCQSCLRVLDYTDKRQDGEELCVCGGEFCGCVFCAGTIRELFTGSPPRHLMFNSIKGWTAKNGVPGYSLKRRVS